jgi:hypothetical protein
MSETPMKSYEGFEIGDEVLRKRGLCSHGNISSGISGVISGFRKRRHSNSFNILIEGDDLNSHKPDNLVLVKKKSSLSSFLERTK